MWRAKISVSQDFRSKTMRLILPLFTILLSLPAQAGLAFSIDTGAAMVMPTGLEGKSENVGPNLNVNIGYQMGNSLRLDLGAVLGQEETIGTELLRPGGFQGLRPAAKLFLLGGSIYAKASLPVSLSGDSKLGLMVGGGYELKLLGLLGGFVEASTGYEGAAGGMVPLEVRAGAVFVW
jgi:hypothetical protein